MLKYKNYKNKNYLKIIQNNPLFNIVILLILHHL